MFNIFAPKKKEIIKINEIIERLQFVFVSNENNEAYYEFIFILKNYNKVFSTTIRTNSSFNKEMLLTNVGDNISFQIEDDVIINSSFKNHSIKLLLDNNLIMKTELSLD